MFAPEVLGVNGGIRAVGLSPGKIVGVMVPEEGVNREAQDLGPPPEGGESGGEEETAAALFEDTILRVSLGKGGFEGRGTTPCWGNCPPRS